MGRSGKIRFDSFCRADSVTGMVDLAGDHNLKLILTVFYGLVCSQGCMCGGGCSRGGSQEKLQG